MPFIPGRSRARVTTAVALSALLVGGAIPSYAIAAETKPLSNLQLDIALNQEYQNSSSRGGVCNFFSAGTGDEGGVFREQVGNVSVVKLDESGAAQRASRANICLPMSEGSIDQRARFSNGSGTLDPLTGAGEVHWSGSFTANAYGGLVPWTLTDPVLSVLEDGSGELRAVAGGFGATAEFPEGGFPLDSRPVTVATFSSVTVQEGTVEFIPDFRGRDYFPLTVAGRPENGRTTESAIPSSLKAGGEWGSWPESFVDFHYESGLSSYWHTSGGSADPDKAPLPVRVTATEDAAVERPLITENPRADKTFPVLEGDDLKIVAAATGATSYAWQRKDEGGESWYEIDGADQPTLRISAIGREWNGAVVRLVAANGAGVSASGELRVTTETPRDLRVEREPGAVLAIESMRPILELGVSGTPGPTAFTVERRFDGGEWAELGDVTVSRADGEYTHRLTLPVAEAAGSSELRVRVENRLGESVSTVAVPYRIVPATGEPQIVLGPDVGLDAADGGMVTVVGAGFSVPENDRNGSFSLDVALFDDEVWQPGEEASQDWIATSPDTEWGQLYGGSLLASGGGFTVRIPVDAEALDPERAYGVATFLRHTNLWWMPSYDDRRADSFTRLPLSAPAEDPAEIAESALTELSRGGVTATVTPDGRITVTVPGQRPDSNVFLSVRSESQALGWHRLDQDRSATAALPGGLASGDHRVVVQDVSGALIGWAPFELVASTGPVDGGGVDSSVGGSGAHVVPASNLATTGAELGAGALLVGLVAALLGSILLLRRRRV